VPSGSPPSLPSIGQTIGQKPPIWGRFRSIPVNSEVLFVENSTNSRRFGGVRFPAPPPSFSILTEFCAGTRAETPAPSRRREPEIERALTEAVRLMSFGGGGKPSPIKAEVLRLLAACIEVLGGRADAVSIRAPSSIFGGPRDGERRSLRAALVRCSWNQSQAARELGLKLPTLRDRIKALGIHVPERAHPSHYSLEELTAALAPVDWACAHPASAALRLPDRKPSTDLLRSCGGHSTMRVASLSGRKAFLASEADADCRVALSHCRGSEFEQRGFTSGPAYICAVLGA